MNFFEVHKTIIADYEHYIRSFISFPNPTVKFIEFRLFWEGHVNRSDLIDAFGISAQEAPTDLNRYRNIAPANMGYDKSAKANFPVRKALLYFALTRRGPDKDPAAPRPMDQLIVLLNREVVDEVNR